MDKIHFIITGGTIDTEFSGKDRDISYKHSIIPEYLKSSPIFNRLEFKEVCMKDSRDIVDADRRNILEAIEYSSLKKAIVTHGTFTMAESAKFIKNNLKRTDKVVIFTGSMVPLKEKDSDAVENLEFAFKNLDTLSPGVYIAMNKRVLDPDEAVKDNIKQIFYSINDNKKRP
jgi:L-asparaginase